MSDHNEIVKELDDAHARAQIAYRAKDVTGYMESFSQDLQYTQLNGTTIGYKQLLHDVERQLAMVSAVDGDYERLNLVIDDKLAIETLVQNAWAEVRVFFFFTKRWHVHRKGIYEWQRRPDGWQIARVRVLAESVT